MVLSVIMNNKEVFAVVYQQYNAVTAPGCHMMDDVVSSSLLVISLCFDVVLVGSTK